MNSVIFGIKIEPDQFKALAPILLLILIPFWKTVVDPILMKFNIELKPLKSVAIGGICAGLSFLFAGVVQMKIEEYHPNEISILWQIPQFFFLMMGEVLLSIPGLQFAFTQAPDYMQSILTAFWFVNNAIGNLIVVLITVVITELNSTKINQIREFFFYAGLMFLAIGIFSYFSSKYKYNQNDEDENENCDNVIVKY